MLPTFPELDMLLVDKFAPVVLGRKYQTGDIVLSRAPYDTRRYICKRVAAVEGEAVPAAADRDRFGGEGRTADTVPANHVWLLGDNPKQSTDSRNYGAGTSAVAEALQLGLDMTRVVLLIQCRQSCCKEGSYLIFPNFSSHVIFMLALYALI